MKRFRIPAPLLADMLGVSPVLGKIKNGNPYFTGFLVAVIVIGAIVYFWTRRR